MNMWKMLSPAITALLLLLFIACDTPTVVNLPDYGLAPLEVDQLLPVTIVVEGNTEETNLRVYDNGAGNGIPGSIIIAPGSRNIERRIRPTEAVGVYQIDFGSNGTVEMFLRNTTDHGVEFNTKGNGRGQVGTLIVDGANNFLGFDLTGDSLPEIVPKLAGFSLNTNFGSSSTQSASVPDPQRALITTGSDNAGNIYVISHEPMNSLALTKFDSMGIPDTSYGSNGNGTEQSYYLSVLGKTTTEEVPGGAVLCDDGSIFSVINFTNYGGNPDFSTGSFIIAKFDSRGFLDNSFGTSGILEIKGYSDGSNRLWYYPECYNLKIFNNTLYLSGGFLFADPNASITNELHMAIWQIPLDNPPSTAADWGPDLFGHGEVSGVDGKSGRDFTMAEDGSIYQVIRTLYQSDTGNYFNSFSVMRYLSDGSLDRDFGYFGGYASNVANGGNERAEIFLNDNETITLLAKPEIQESQGSRLIHMNTQGDWLSQETIDPAKGYYLGLLELDHELYAYGYGVNQSAMEVPSLAKISGVTLDSSFGDKGHFYFDLPGYSPWTSANIGQSVFRINHQGNLSVLVNFESGAATPERHILNYYPVYEK